MTNFLLVRRGARRCALELAHVEEAMRPLPCAPLSDEGPTFVRGVSTVRGRPTPVIDLGELFGDGAQERPNRLVSLRLPGDRGVGLLVDEILGVRDPAEVTADALPPLLQGAASEVVEVLGVLDGELLTVLRAGKLVPDETWDQISADEVPE